MASMSRATYKVEISEAAMLDRAEDIVDDFLLLLRRESAWNDIFDVKVLSVPKATLVSAFMRVIEAESRPEYRRTLAKAGIMLSRFQEGIGARMSLLPVTIDESAAEPEAEETMSRHREYIERFDRAYAMIEPDAHQLAALFERSMAIALRREREFHAGHQHGKFAGHSQHGYN
jgi:hypothetical protein